MVCHWGDWGKEGKGTGPFHHCHWFRQRTCSPLHTRRRSTEHQTLLDSSSMSHWWGYTAHRHTLHHSTGIGASTFTNNPHISPLWEQEVSSVSEVMSCKTICHSQQNVLSHMTVYGRFMESNQIKHCHHSKPFTETPAADAVVGTRSCNRPSMCSTAHCSVKSPPLRDTGLWVNIGT